MANQKKEDIWGAWAVIVVLFIVGLWPFALGLLFFKLFGGDKKKRQQAPPLQGNPVSAPVPPTAQNKTTNTVRRAMKSPLPKKSNATLMAAIGGLLTLMGIGNLYGTASMLVWMGEFSVPYLEKLLWGLSMLVAGGALIFSSVSMRRSIKRYAKYLIVMGDREAMAVEELARTLGYTPKKVERDLQRMIDRGYFGGKAYLNVELGYLFRSRQADQEIRQKQAAQAAQPPQETEEGYSGILRNIRRANDAIADPVLSAKIDRLEDVTARIFKAVEDDPPKRERIDTFLNYYLPTTQKLLHSYASFEAAGVEGENLRQAKQRIEATMDSIVRGFEHQLDELYKMDVLDIDSDIRVMETMLRRDTASVADDFGLGSSTRPMAEEEAQ